MTRGTGSPSQGKGQSGRGNAVKSYVILAGVLAAAAAILSVFPDRADAATASAIQYLREMIAILPAVMVIVGLFSVFVSKDLVVRHLGRKSRVKGLLLSILFGSLPTGPLYIAFPVALALRKKGASIANVVVFLSAWACIKIPQELFELQFLGVEFMLARLSLTVVVVVLMGLFIEKVIERSDDTAMEMAVEADGGV